MQTRDYLRYIVEGIHSAVFATVEMCIRDRHWNVDV